MTRIYSYILRFDDGAAPNPFWDLCTLTICKPVIRRNAKIGDWIVGTGSKNAELNRGKIYDFSKKLVYAMKVSEIKTLQDYDGFCNSSKAQKIPNWYSDKWQHLLGDCIYDYSNGAEPVIRKSVHNETNRERDLSGVNALSSNHFYYFGRNAIEIPIGLKQIIKCNQGHKRIENSNLIIEFEDWIKGYKPNFLYADPQLRWQFDKKVTEKIISECAKQDYEDDLDDTEEVVC